MTGPDDLTFTGEIVSGSEFASFVGDSSLEIHLMFDGMWSNSIEGYGEVSIISRENFLDHAYLDAYTVPEPSSLVLFGSSIAGIWDIGRSRINS